MKRFYILLIMLICHSLCDAQEISIKQLKGTKWETNYPEGNSIITEFSDSIITETYYCNGDVYLKTKKEYYISKSVPENFDKTKVGNHNINGRYIIINNPRIAAFSTDRIVSFTSSSMKVQSMGLNVPTIGKPGGYSVYLRKY